MVESTSISGDILWPNFAQHAGSRVTPVSPSTRSLRYGYKRPGLMFLVSCDDTETVAETRTTDHIEGSGAVQPY